MLGKNQWHPGILSFLMEDCKFPYEVVLPKTYNLKLMLCRCYYKYRKYEAQRNVLLYTVRI